MEEILSCSRCKKTYTHNKKIVFDGRFQRRTNAIKGLAVLVGYAYDNQNKKPTHEYLLCDKCLNALEIFLKGE